MSREQDQQLYETLKRTGRLLQDAKPVEGETYSLESILEEFGTGGAKPALTQEGTEIPKTETPAAPPPAPPQPEEEEETVKRAVPSRLARKKKPDPSQFDTIRLPALRDGAAAQKPTVPPQAPKKEYRPEPSPVAPPPSRDEGDSPPDRVFLKDVMRETVDQAMAANEDGILPPPVPLSERIKSAIPKREKGEKREKRDKRQPRREAVQDTEQLWDEPEQKKEPEHLPPEPDPDDAVRAERRRCKHLQHFTVLGAIPALVLIVLAALESFSALPDLWWDDDMLRGVTLGVGLLLTALLCMDVWRSAALHLKKGRIGCELAAAMVAAVTLAACVLGALGVGMSQSPCAASAAVIIWLCQWGLLQRASWRREAFHLAAVGGKPPFAMAPTAAGVCKQKGILSGFYRMSDRRDPAAMWQRFTVPLLLVAATVLSALVAASSRHMERFLWIWSALLCATIPLGLPLHFTLPMAWLQHRLSRGGSALAGYAGARAVSRGKHLVLTEGDLFPPGTVEFNGYKVFGEERMKMLSYAAAVTYASHSQLYPLFAQQLASEGGFRSEFSDLQFYEDGGVGGTIHGESVLMGSAYFMKKRHVALPHDLKLQTGVFLAVDGTLCAIFVVKYQPSRNVEWALRAMKRAHMRPVLAVRSGNVTPGLLKRKFGVDCHPIYPDVSTRLALSDVVEQTAPQPCAILYREGLMPLVETAVGSKRLVSAVRLSTILSHLSGVAGLLLTYYFTSVGSFATLTPAHMLLFGALGLLPTVLLAGTVRHF